MPPLTQDANRAIEDALSKKFYALADKYTGLVMDVVPAGYHGLIGITYKSNSFDDTGEIKRRRSMAWITYDNSKGDDIHILRSTNQLICVQEYTTANWIDSHMVPWY